MLVPFMSCTDRSSLCTAARNSSCHRRLRSSLASRDSRIGGIGGRVDGTRQTQRSRQGEGGAGGGRVALGPRGAQQIRHTLRKVER